MVAFRKKNLKWLSMIFVLVLVFVFVVSCGSSAPPTTPTPPPAPAPAPSPEPKQEAPNGSAVSISHTLEGRDDCQMCHKEDGVEPNPADHAGRTNDTCTTCHKPAPSE
jgi:hypothetical protein